VKDERRKSKEDTFQNKLLPTEVTLSERDSRKKREERAKRQTMGMK